VDIIPILGSGVNGIRIPVNEKPQKMSIILKWKILNRTVYNFKRNLFVSLLIIFAPVRSQNFIRNYSFPEEIIKNEHYSSDRVATELSFIGEYNLSLLFFDQYKSFPSKLNYDSLFIQNFKPVLADKYIIEKAKQYQIVILNEAHHQPRHRIFTESLLSDLYDIGFRYFGAEALMEADYSIENKEYPTTDYGYYIAEPKFGSLIRKAIKTGYSIFGYDSHGITNFQNNFADLELRDKLQAEKILNILKNDPNAKIIIHCGYGHLVESKREALIKTMGVWIKEMSGINPLTIDQTRMTESSSSIYEYSYFHLAEPVAYPAVFIDSSGIPFNGPPGENWVDIRMYHPRTKFIRGRPDWLLSNDYTFVDLTDSILSDCPCLVFAYYNNEDINNAVPADIIYFSNSVNNKSLVLNKSGIYTVIVRTLENKLGLSSNGIRKYKLEGSDFFEYRN